MFRIPGGTDYVMVHPDTKKTEHVAQTEMVFDELCLIMDTGALYSQLSKAGLDPRDHMKGVPVMVFNLDVENIGIYQIIVKACEVRHKEVQA